MAKRKDKTEQEKERKAIKSETPDGYDEVGDHWDDMFTFDIKHPEVAGNFLGTALHIGENDSAVHILLVDGVRTGVWGSTLLDSRMKSVEEGDRIMIRYMGTEQSPKSGREYKDFKVFRAKKAPSKGSSKE